MSNAGLMDDLRSDLLRVWQLWRRQLDDLLVPLLADEALTLAAVTAHLSGLIAAADLERTAFEAFLAAHELLDRAVEEPGPTAPEDDDELSEARQRALRATDLSRRQGHPSQSRPPATGPDPTGPSPVAPTEPAAADPTATIHQLTPRGHGPKKP